MVIVRPAVVGDVPDILRLINELALRQLLLPRSPASVIEQVRDFVVAEHEGKFAGCGALHVVWSNLAEVRSLAVEPALHKGGIGRAIVERLVAEGERLGVAQLFAFTYVAGFFEKLGFRVVEHASLPHKVFSDCIHCPKFNACDEIAMVRVLKEDGEAHARGPLSLPLAGMLPRAKV